METNLLAYAAGYIDGDGCFYLGKSIQKPKMITVYEYSIQVVSVKRAVLDHFKEVFGGYIRKKPYKPNHRDAFCWTIKGIHAFRLAESIMNYLIDK